MAEAANILANFGVCVFFFSASKFWMAEAANVLANFFFAFVFTGWWLGELGLAEEPKKQNETKRQM